ncbi:filamentous hemagglutinin N-terminal domain-containing protein [Nostoc sp. TCL26-01]|nr:filamentous hemagglutinin N-terminal domain-containing protein [Nostoc sp. TCL26-01]
MGEIAVVKYSIKLKIIGQRAIIYALATAGFLVNPWWSVTATAQIDPDATLGNENSQLTPNVTINNLPAKRIDGGAIKGNNLFHSFREFNINEGERVYFHNPNGISNIFTRVTGTNSSQILGTLGVTGNANLFLINPHGIIFGQNARLDIAGSLIASTASGINFADGFKFTTSHQQSNPLLTVSIPTGLQLGENPQKILVQGDGKGIRTSNSPVVDVTNGLRVGSDRTLALVGGNIDFTGGTLKTAGGRIELGSVAGSGLVSLNAVEQGFALGYADVSKFGDIQFSRSTAVDASGLSGGTINIRGRKLTITNGSQIEATTLGVGTGGKLTVTASELVELRGTSSENRPSSLSTDNRDSGTVPGELTINTRQLILQPGGRISASNSDTGLGGTITVNADELVELIGTFTSSGGLRSSGLSIQTTGRGNSGNLIINTKKLSIREGAEISASTYGAGNGGNIIINASEIVELKGISNSRNTLLPSRIVAEAGNNIREVNRNAPSAPVTGKGGNLAINTRQLTIQDEARLTVSSRSENRNAQGAGTLDVKASNILLNNQGQIAATTFIGQGGNIKLAAQDFLVLRRHSTISTTAGTARAGGDGGNIDINTDFIVTARGENSDITANAFRGSGGKVNITAQSIFGIKPLSRQELQTLLATDNPDAINPSLLLSNDITAISQQSPSLSGQVTLNTPESDPSSGLVELTTDIVDVSGLINQNLCVAASQGSEFIITGRGGLPPSPYEILNLNTGWEDWQISELASRSVQKKNSQSHTPNALLPTRITEAQGWVKNLDGTVILTSQPVVSTPQGTWLSHPTCQHN